MVFVLSKDGHPLMPTERYGKVRRLLRDGLAVVAMRDPLTIRLTYDIEMPGVQPVDLGVDAGSGHIGLAAATEKKELFSAEVQTRQNIQNLISTRREARKTRRNRKTRYRKARFDNRRRPKGWLAPSVEQKIQTHLNLIDKVHRILPLTRTVIEVAQFDTQLLKNPDIQGTEYQQGEQLGFENTREYVLWRDNHECQCCHGKSKDPILCLHHIESRKTGGNSPDNLVTLCKTCHNAYHRGEIKLKLKRSSKSLRDAAIMTSMRWELYNRARLIFPDVHLTYGYITKHTRITNELEKGHAVDARCISGHPGATPCPERWLMRQIANHSRSLHVMNMTKGGKRRSAIAPHYIGKTRLQRHDKVLWNGIKCFIAGSTNGRPILRDINRALVTPIASVNPKTVTFLSRKRGGFILQTI